MGQAVFNADNNTLPSDKRSRSQPQRTTHWESSGPPQDSSPPYRQGDTFRLPGPDSVDAPFEQRIIDAGKGPQVDSIDLVSVLPTPLYDDAGAEDAGEDGGQELVPHRQITPDSSELWDYNFGLPGPFGLDLCKTPGERIAYIFFFQCVSRIIPASDGPGSGYRELAALALTSPVLMDTVLSVSTRYMSHRGRIPDSLALSRQSRALRTLRESLGSLLGDHSQSDDLMSLSTTPLASAKRLEILAAIALQFTIEMMAGSSATKTHLRCAVNLLRELGWLKERPDSFIGRMLVFRVAFVDIVSSLLWYQRSLLLPDFWLFHPNDAGGDISRPSLQEMTGCPPQLFCFLAEISHLASDPERDLYSQDKMAKAYEIETALRIYGSKQLANDVATLHPSVSHLETLSKCYYWTAHILLQRRVCLDARTSPRVQFAVNSLICLMDSMPIGCGPDSSLSLPLSVAAHEAIDGQQRNCIIKKGRLLAAEYPSKTRDVMNDSFEAIWADMDRFHSTGEETWRPNDTADQDFVRSETLFIA
ncbi:hypothetical protein A1O3_05414 [Capronia epimyces CBS 606.96]|uniref:Transcription factor domain-containing protein n=1 Tax=Capronia epimyces CBS 606.96 TaxID=1182542 RepID=W9XVZ2_9EURO|nr:uncharacterized protein A1O3_05414 [Capronia epimyces CBS 606.96]EXJ84742.1 hypothetical protein A1O3_05414 [Capronia epimyces CBS 606.96]